MRTYGNFGVIVLYVNPYMVVTPRGYTKHYYNGSQRIASRIGGHWHDESVFVSSPALTNAAESLWAATLHTEELQEQETPFDEVYVSSAGAILPVAQYGPVVANLSGMHADDLLSPVFSGHNSEQLDYDTVGIYFYHSDHLGSANWITNSQGEAVQYLHYMPFGELWENQQFYAYDERYKFTGKERDTETGYDYFGARYYASALPMWLSVDPLADEYPSINPYAYCAWNPMKYVDPKGKDIYTFDNDGFFTGDIIKQEGDPIGRIHLSDETHIDFKFNDLEDAERICLPYSEKYFSFNGEMDNNAITHISLVGIDQINSIMPKEDIGSLNIFDAFIYAWSQSRGGMLDFVNQPVSFLQQDANALFLPMDGRNVTYNNFDFGNYLWGMSMRKLKIPLRISLLGAHIDNFVHHFPYLDSHADQDAIRNGFNCVLKR